MESGDKNSSMDYADSHNNITINLASQKYILDTVMWT